MRREPQRLADRSGCAFQCQRGVPLEHRERRIEEDEHLGSNVGRELLNARGYGAEERDWSRYPNLGRDGGRSVKASNIAQE
jgi:hypothetical protein